MELFKLYGSILVDSDQAQQSIQKTTNEADSFAEKLGKGISTAAKWSAAIVTGATTAVGGMVAFATHSAKAADEIDKMSQKLGLSREAYQEWDYVLSQAGVDINSMETGMKTLTNKIDDAKNGSESATEMFNKLGISMTDLQTKSREDIFEQVITGFQNMEDSTSRAALANDLFGKSGQNLTPLFNETAKATEGLIKKSHELGMIMSDEAIDAGVSLTDTMDTLKRSFEAVGANLGTALAPLVEDFANMIIDAMPTIQGMVEELSPVIEAMFEGLLPPLMDLAEQLFPVLLDLIEEIIPPITSIVQQILPVIINLLNMILPPIMTLIQQLLPVVIALLEPILSLLQPILAVLQPILDLVMAILTPLSSLLGELLPPLVNVLSDMISNVLDVLTPILEWLADFIGGVLGVEIGILTDVIGVCADAFGAAWNFIQSVWSVAANFFNGIWTSITSIFSGVADFFGSAFSGAWNAIVGFFSPLGEFFEGVWEKVKGAFTDIAGVIGQAINGTVAAAVNGVLNAACGIINGFISAINGVIGVINAIPGVHISKLDKLNAPQLEEGGILEKGEVGILEGNGAEAVVPLDQNKKWISKVAEDMAAATGGVAGEKANQTLDDILATLQAMMSALPDMLVDSLVEGVRFDVDKREFGRLVRQVGA